MASRSGTKLGRYEIRSQISAGGMREVYSATDTWLDRIVQIKVRRASDPDTESGSVNSRTFEQSDKGVLI